MKEAIVLMGYGSPDSKGDIMEYLRDVYGGREPPDYAIRETEAKYSTFNYISPSTGILRNLERKVRDSFNDSSVDVFLSFKHWKPSLKDIALRIADGSYEAVYAIPLFPIKNGSVMDSYVKPFTSYLGQAGFNGNIKFINGFSDKTSLIEYWTDECKSSKQDGDLFLFTAHSLPHEVSMEKDYYGNLVIMAAEICQRASIEHWSFAFQSRGSYGKVWLEPSVYVRLKEISQKDFKRIITVPIGFIYDHLEVLYDLDRLFGAKVKESGFDYGRVNLPNDSERMVMVIREIVGGLKN
ncbi:ferrochelatase [Cuniculiplasma sp. SKW4]|uniref:ferrochelatase n=1 Tax=Cuniculiplasma sp. SKW4 TaxID=3400171 RepID=UPI003FD4A7BC